MYGSWCREGACALCALSPPPTPLTCLWIHLHLLLPAAKISVLAAAIDHRISALGLLDPVDNTGEATALHMVTIV